jgi:hypothetical protein
MKRIYQTVKRGASSQAAAFGLKTVANRFQEWQQGLELTLAGSTAGRIVLHLALAVMTWHFTWHFQGILRELTRH